LLNCWTSSSDISGYHADFHEGHGTVGAWQGRGTAWARHGRGMGTAFYVCELAFIYKFWIHNRSEFRISLLQCACFNTQRQSYPITSLDRPLGLQEVEAPRVSRQLAHEGGKAVSPMHQLSFPRRASSILRFTSVRYQHTKFGCQGCENPSYHRPLRWCV